MNKRWIGKMFRVGMVLVSGLIGFTPVSAQTDDEHAGHHPVIEQVSNAADLTEGEVRKIDKELGKITLRHGVIKNLDMPSMTMVFRVKNQALLEAIQVGDKVRFKAERENGVLSAAEIQLMK